MLLIPKTISNIKSMYCLTHNCFCVTYTENGTTWHRWHGNGQSVENCFGPFTATVPPKPLTEDEWQGVMKGE